MKNAVTRKEAADIMKVSVPTLRKYITRHREILKDNKIDIAKLDSIITEESAKTLKKTGE